MACKCVCYTLCFSCWTVTRTKITMHMIIDLGGLTVVQFRCHCSRVRQVELITYNLTYVYDVDTYVCYIHGVSKKVPTFKLSVTLSNLNQFSKILHCWKAYEICYKTYQHYPPHLMHVATCTLPWKLKIQIFCRYLADMKET